MIPTKCFLVFAMLPITCLMDYFRFCGVRVREAEETITRFTFFLCRRTAPRPYAEASVVTTTGSLWSNVWRGTQETQQKMTEECPNINFDSFHNTSKKTTLPNVLGTYCNARNIEKKLTGPWVGIAGPAIPLCKICCVNKRENGTLLYLSTKAPKSFPCGKGKKCNREGRCVKTK
uniref:Putative ixostatin n=1 Tax=Ixodes ricinus TaxID=34613 RepID=A0A0K8RH36_IXORI